MPPGFGGQKDSFKEKYGEPDVDAAKQILDAAGVKTPVDDQARLPAGALRPERRGRGDRAGATSSNASGLFEVTTDDAEWEEYQTITKEGAYDLFLLGWFPDFLGRRQLPVAVHASTVGSSRTATPTTRSTSLLDQEIGADRRRPRATSRSVELQDIVAEDVPLIPSWNGQNVAVANVGDDGCRGHARPDVHLPVLDDQQGRLSP